LLQCECDKEDDAFYEQRVSEMKEDGTELCTGFVAASEVTNEGLNSTEEAVMRHHLSYLLSYLILFEQFLQKKKEGLAALSEWKHLNCLRPFVQDSIHDDILRRVCTPSRADAPRNRAKDILSMIDLDAIEAMETPLIEDIPGGTITFLFEKCSTTNLEIE
jgi:DNA repair and recombination protein RAD54B